MKIFLIFASIMLSGCATPPLWLANYYDSQDPCQLRNNGGQYPSWCGASGGRVYIYDRAYSSGPAQGYIK